MIGHRWWSCLAAPAEAEEDRFARRVVDPVVVDHTDQPPQRAAADDRQALRLVVRRAASHGRGVDSTSLCFLAAGADAGAGLVTLRWGEAEARNDDAAFAARAADALPAARHLVVPQRDLPALVQRSRPPR